MSESASDPQILEELVYRWMEVRRHCSFTVPQALSVLLQVASGLGYVNSKAPLRAE